LLGTIAEVGKMGYDGVEFAGFFGHSAKDVKKAMDDAGLVCSGSHSGYDSLVGAEKEAHLDYLREIECPFAIVPWIAEEKRNSPSACLETAKVLTELAGSLRGSGMLSGFHAHDGDMKPLEGGKSAWYLLGENTPDDFMLQYDTCNGMYGGSDPVKPLIDFAGRGKTVHAKEYPAGKVIGTGEVPWVEVVAALPGAGCEWLVVEHETYVDMTPFEAVAQGLAGLQKFL
jgi:sugar phosphate isomerase/epimerase